MSARRAIHISLSADCDPGESPNRYVGRITADLRLHFPPHVNPAEVREVTADAVDQLWRQVRDWEVTV